MSKTLAPQIKFRATDADGLPIPGAKLYTYAAGTTTPKATYTDSSGSTANTNPIICDARGEADVWLSDDDAYKFTLHDADDVLIWTKDNIRKITNSSQVTFDPSGTGAVARTVQDKLRETVSVKDFGAVGDGVTDDTAAIQAALNYYAQTSGRGTVFMAAGKYRIETTLTIPEHVRLIGESSDRFQAGTPGSELAYYGPDASTAVECSTGDSVDWGKGSIENVRIQNWTMTTSGYGLRCRNVTNNSLLKNVHIAGFPTRQCYVYEASPPVTPSTPSAFSIENCFFYGGVIPLEIARGVEAISVSNTICGTDSTTTAGVLVSENPNDPTGTSSQRCSITFNSCIVEIDSSSSTSCVGFTWVTDVAINFVGCSVQRNSGTGTDGAWRYTNTSRKLPTANFINCTAWRMASCASFSSAGVTIPLPVSTTPKSFSWRPAEQESAFVFVAQNVAAGASGAGAPFANQVGFIESAGIVMPRGGLITGFSSRSNAAITAGNISPRILKNGASFVTSLTLDSSNQQAYSHVDSDNNCTSSFQFSAGDRIGVYVNSDAGLLPAGSLDVQATVFVKYI